MGILSLASRVSLLRIALFVLIGSGLGALGFDVHCHGATNSDCSLCENAHWIACRRCDSKGEYRSACHTCRGQRKDDCPVCRANGRLSCRNCGGRGEIRYSNDEAIEDCKVCSKGTVTCFYCSGSKRTECKRCEGAARFTTRCGACDGHGGFPCPSCGPPKLCPVCENGKSMPCSDCYGEKSISAYCKDCAGNGKRVCAVKNCLGGREVCRNCYGTGRIRFVTSTGNRAGTRKCDKCKGKAFSKCENCRGKGTSPCDRSKKLACETCEEKGKTRCVVCVQTPAGSSPRNRDS